MVHEMVRALPLRSWGLEEVVQREYLMVPIFEALICLLVLMVAEEEAEEEQVAWHQKH